MVYGTERQKRAEVNPRNEQKKIKSLNNYYYFSNKNYRPLDKKRKKMNECRFLNVNKNLEKIRRNLLKTGVRNR